MDGLATAAFGMNINSFGSEESLFTIYAAELFKANPVEMTMMMLKYLVPGMDFVLETFNINIWKVSFILIMNVRTNISYFRRKRPSSSMMSSSQASKHEGRDDRNGGMT